VPKPTLLIVDDNEAFLTSLQRALRGDYEVRCARSAAEAITLLSPSPDVALLDLRLKEDDPANRDGLVLLQTLRQQFPHLPVLMITAYGDIDTAVECMKQGAVDFIQKPKVDLREINTRLARALEHARLSRRVTELEYELHLIEPRQIVGNSSKIQEIKRVIEAVARDGSVTVLIRGETGTGKELVARAIHASGWRRAGPFIPVTLNALPSHTVEAELFGYEPGAFTDARVRHIGYLEKAHGGVLFLDEIGDVEANVQAKLLRFLEEREFQRLGSTSPVKVDVQIITATNADLEARVKEGRFREDLYFRLKVHEIVLPPLRERVEDIPLLVDHFLRLFRQQGKRVGRISPSALEVLQRSSWPGNVRQLKNAIESAIFWAELRQHEQIEVEDLPADVRQSDEKLVPRSTIRIGDKAFAIHEALARVELAYIDEALQAAHGKKTEAWKLLAYPNRFALSRRVRRILEQYPHLGDEFPHLKAKFLSRFTGKGRTRSVLTR